MEASSSPFPPLEAVRTLYPKHSRNALSHSSMFWSLSMQRTTPLESSGYADESMVSPQASLFSSVKAPENCSELLNQTLLCEFRTRARSWGQHREYRRSDPQPYCALHPEYSRSIGTRLDS